MRKAAIALVCSLLMVFAASFGFAADEPPVKYGTSVGEKAQPVQLKGIGEGTPGLDTGALKKDTVLMLVSSVCTACNAELADMAANTDKFGAFDVFAVVIDVDPARAAGALSKFKIPMVSDSEWKLGNAVGLASAPSAVVLAKDGTIKLKKYGYKGNQWKEYADVK